MTAWCALVILSFLAAFVVGGMAGGELDELLVFWAFLRGAEYPRPDCHLAVVRSPKSRLGSAIVALAAHL